MAGKREKTFTDYVKGEAMDAMALYRQAPVSMFLTNIVTISDSVEHCSRNFPKKKDKSFTSKSEAFLREINASSLCSVMGHFELYQKSCFAALIEISRHFKAFDIDDCVRALRKDSNLNIDVSHLLAYRGENAAVGLLIADNLHSWHDPNVVNKHFRCVLKDVNIFSISEITALRALWQIRHSMAHTGGFLTKHDSEKVASLGKHGGKALRLENNFILATTRRLHKIAKSTMTRINKALRSRLDDESYNSEEIQKFIEIYSSRASWL